MFSGGTFPVLADGSFYSLDNPFFVLLLVLVVTELAIPAWVYYDARKREMDAGIWFHVAMLPAINLFGLVAYLSARERETDNGNE